MVLLLAPVVDRSLLEDSLSWMEISNSIVDEMLLHGNLQAEARKYELQQLQHLFNQIPPLSPERPLSEGHHAIMSTPFPRNRNDVMPMSAVSDQHTVDTNQHRFDPSFFDEAVWQNGFTADQLLMVADNLDLDGLEWMTAGSSTADG